MGTPWDSRASSRLSSAGAAVRLAAAEADRLGTIVEGLLLSRTEGRSTPLVTVDLAEIARDRVDQWQALAQESAVTIRYDGPLTASFSAVSTAAEQILDNYVDNALSVSPGDTTIIVRVTTSVPAARVDRPVRQHVPALIETVQLEVLDEGPRLSVEECSRAFDRFWRARSDSAGSGLGLAIVAQLAKASRATVALVPRDTGGLAASATFTAARGAATERAEPRGSQDR